MWRRRRGGATPVDTGLGKGVPPDMPLTGTSDIWQNGYDTASGETDELIGQKDDYIHLQSQIIQGLMRVVERTGTWGSVPPELKEALRDYV